jgi:hypothetical protein
LQRLRDLCETAARTHHHIISRAHFGNLPFQSLEHWRVNHAVERHGIRNRSLRAQQALQRYSLLVVVLLIHGISMYPRAGLSNPLFNHVLQNAVEIHFSTAVSART